MWLLALSLVLPQSIEPVPFLPTAGTEVLVRARDAQDAPIAGLAIDDRAPGGAVTRLGVTSPAGELRFAPTEVGVHELRAQPSAEAATLVALVDVRPQARRGLSAWICVPLALALVWWSARRAAVRREPCSRAP